MHKYLKNNCATNTISIYQIHLLIVLYTWNDCIMLITKLAHMSYPVSSYSYYCAFKEHRENAHTPDVYGLIAQFFLHGIWL